jgi:hypothetical protein
VSFIRTIIIVQELHAEFRGYTLKGREFVLKYPTPRKDEGITIDGGRLLDDYWVVSKEEFMRVVPEARNRDFDSEEIYIPTFVARISFRPAYLKSSARTLLE